MARSGAGASKLVSIIMPLYNTAAFLAQSIQSIQGQTWPDWELIVIDDASTDHSAEVVASIALTDPRVRLIRSNENWGPAETRNRGLALAQGQFVAFCDSDDLWLPEKLDRQMTNMAKSGVAICCTSYARMRQDGRLNGQVVVPPSSVSYQELLRSNVIGMSSALVDRAQCGKELQFPALPRGQDYALWLRLLANGMRCQGLSDVLVHYRLRQHSVSSAKLRAAWSHWRVLRDVASLAVWPALVAFAYYGWKGLLSRALPRAQ